MALSAQQLQQQQGYYHPLPLEEVLTPIAPNSISPVPQHLPSGEYHQKAAKYQQARQRVARHQSRLAWLGTVCFTVFLVFGLLQVTRSLVENVADLAKLGAETTSVSEIQHKAQSQQAFLSDAINYYQSPQGTEALVRNYLNAAGPNEILISLDAL